MRIRIVSQQHSDMYGEIECFGRPQYPISCRTGSGSSHVIDPTHRLYLLVKWDDGTKSWYEYGKNVLIPEPYAN